MLRESRDEVRFEQSLLRASYSVGDLPESGNRVLDVAASVEDTLLLASGEVRQDVPEEQRLGIARLRFADLKLAVPEPRADEGERSRRRPPCRADCATRRADRPATPRGIREAFTRSVVEAERLVVQLSCVVE